MRKGIVVVVVWVSVCVVVRGCVLWLCGFAAVSLWMVCVCAWLCGCVAVLGALVDIFGMLAAAGLGDARGDGAMGRVRGDRAVSYTHLTLPTICSG
eukprot:13449293-Alexandrium_andersonii.AAC.1